MSLGDAKEGYSRLEHVSAVSLLCLFIWALCLVLSMCLVEAGLLGHFTCRRLMHPFLPSREQPIFTTRAHVFQIDPSTKKNWVPASKQAVTVSYFYDSTRNSYRIISVDGAKVGGCRYLVCFYVEGCGAASPG